MSALDAYCAYARATELLGDRWTLHLLRDLLRGEQHYNALARAHPGLSRAVLSRRLRRLQHDGLLEHRGDRYLLTAAGQDLAPVLEQLAAWALRWTFAEPDDTDRLLWWFHLHLAVPQARLVLGVVLDDVGRRYWVVAEDRPSLATTDPGVPVDVELRTTTDVLERLRRGTLTLEQAVREGAASLLGSHDAVEAVFGALRQNRAPPLSWSSSQRLRSTPPA